MDIVIKRPNDKIDKLRVGFLAAVKREEEDEGLSDMDFFKKWLKQQVFNIYKTGMIIIAKETTEPDIDDNVVESVT